MKIIAYSVRDEEIEIFNSISFNLGFEIKLVSQHLTEDNINLAEGFDAVIFTGSGTVNRKVLEMMKKFNIKFASTKSAGTDNIDLKSAKELEIKFANVPSYSPNSVSEYAILCVLALLRNYNKYITRINNQDFTIKNLLAKEIRNQVIGVVGVGKIGSLTVKHLSGFSPKKILVNDVFEKDELKAIAEYVSLDEIYKNSDVIIYHIPLLEETRYLINAHSISKMKDGVIIINLSRGEILNTKDALEAVNSGKISAMALDVYENENKYFRFDYREKYIEDEHFAALLRHPNIIVTPHIGFFTDEAVKNQIETSLNNVSEFLKTNKCQNEIIIK
ncbi:NAD(P)-dependent oxidoreductase [uncultured Brachyspira sp.]|uniref:NAD(P)-dependent oxidoreductase n=1 Tax=uncultured Brachyspira sp. TaxID=221953 RepID=UPI002600AE9E|nr:NAD(P)-dependent oxidoreductase [uncultured Brachyspira sp.]